MVISKSTQAALQEWSIPSEDLKFFEVITHGHFGDICRGRWHGDVLIYTFPGCKESEGQLELFWSEVALLSRLRHENLELFMGAVIEPVPCIVTSAKKGPSLYEKIHIRKEPLHLKDKISIATQVAQAASYLHAKGITLHRRLNSHNIFLESKVQLCLIDQRSINSNLYSSSPVSSATSAAASKTFMSMANCSSPSPRLLSKSISRSPPSSPPPSSPPPASSSPPLLMDTLAACCTSSASNVPASRSSIASTCSTSSTESTGSTCSRACKLEKLSSMFFSRSNSSSSGCGSNASSPTSSPSPYGNHNPFNYLNAVNNSLSYSQYTFTHPSAETSGQQVTSSPSATGHVYNTAYCAHAFSSSFNSSCIREQLSYLAPELIRTLDFESIPSMSRCGHVHEYPEAVTTSQHTMATDVYAFGTILYELIAYKFPHSKLSTENIISRVSNGYHESVSKLKSCPSLWSDLMKTSWHANPAVRPSFKHICKLLQASSKRTDQLISGSMYVDASSVLSNNLSSTKSSSPVSSPLPISCSTLSHNTCTLSRQFSSSEPEKLNFDPENDSWPWYWSSNNNCNNDNAIRKPSTPQHVLYTRNQ